MKLGLMKHWSFFVSVACLLSVPVAAETTVKEPIPPSRCLVLHVKGMISPGTAQYLKRGLAEAEQTASCLVVTIDTPGGHLESTREIVQLLLNATVPTVFWVGPSGAHAGSAGVFLVTSAIHAYMAPGTTIGAAHPVMGTGEDIQGEMKRKLLNDTKAFAQSIAEKRGRNKTWLVAAVEDSVAVTAEEAEKLKVINGVAPSLEAALLKVWPTAPILREFSISWSEKFVTFLAHPNVAYLLLGFGALGVYIEISHPGLIFPGITGVICLVLSFMSMNLLPINYGGVALLVLGIALLIAEIFVPSFGILGIGGIVSFLMGSLFFMNDLGGMGRVSLSLILPMTAMLGGVAFWIGRSVVKVLRNPAQLGKEAMLGKEVLIESWNEQTAEGRGVFDGEIWTVKSLGNNSCTPGTRRKVVQVVGLKLIVE